MSKHMLYSSNQNSPVLNLSIEERNSSTKGDANTRKMHCLNSGLKRNEINQAAVSHDNKTVLEFSQHYCESDSDSMDEGAFFNNSVVSKLPYTLKEDEFILKFVLQGQNIFRTSSLSLWKYLEAKKDNPKRTYQSLKNRFLRNIKPKLLTTYRYMIDEEQSVQNILAKFPELKKGVQKRKTIEEINLRERNDGLQKNDENKVSSSNLRENNLEQTTVAQSRNDQNRIKITTGTKTNLRSIERKNGCINVTFKLNNLSPVQNYSPSRFVGIYEKFLRLKKKNVLVPCSKCGRGRSELDKAEESDSENESDNFIVNSDDRTLNLVSGHASRNFRSEICSLDLPSSSTPQKSKKRRREIVTNLSPSLLHDINENEKNEQSVNNISRAQNFQQNEATVVPKETYCGGTKRLKDSFSDKEISSLYDETVVSCQEFLHSDDEEGLVIDYFKKLTKVRSKTFKSKNSNINIEEIELLFGGSDSSSLGSLSISMEPSLSKKKSPNEKSTVITSNLAKTPLAKNMVKMLSNSSEKQKKN